MNSVFLAYAGPPLLGAFIGYLTNKVAIRMLFRPLKKWRILGIPVPMTPGVIPSKRHDLARNIGEMVGTHLLTSRDIGSALSEERFQDHLSQLVDNWINEQLSRDLGPVDTLVPERFQTYLKVGIRTLKYQFRTGVHRYVQSDEFEQRVARTIREQLDSLGTRELNSLVSVEERQSLYGFVDTVISDLLAGDAAEQWLAANLRENFLQAADAGKCVSDYLPEPLQNLIVETILQRSPDILQQLARMLSEPPVRDRIIAAIRAGVEDFISSLGPVGSLARGFLDMNVLEHSVRDYLTNKHEEIRSWLENPEVQQRFSTVLTEQARKYMDTPLAEILEGAPAEQFESVCREISVQVLAILRTRGVTGALSAMLRDSFEEMLGGGRKSIEEISAQLLQEESAAAFRKTIVAESIALLRSTRVRQLLDKIMNSMFDSVLHRPVGVLHKLLPGGVRTGLTEYAVLTINRILLREVPNLVESLNIRRIVTEKVDTLDLLRLEGLLLSIMEEQFKYINLFGALLGFLIGLVNLLVLQVP